MLIYRELIYLFSFTALVKDILIAQISDFYKKLAICAQLTTKRVLNQLIQYWFQELIVCHIVGFQICHKIALLPAPIGGGGGGVSHILYMSCISCFIVRLSTSFPFAIYFLNLSPFRNRETVIPRHC